MRAGLVALGFVVAATRDGHAYEFWLRAQTIGQAYEVRDYRLAGPDLFLGRRRFTETLALRITDVGDLAATRRRSRLPDRGLRISWQSYLRVDHDFGTFTAGAIQVTGQPPRDALDVIPELGASVAQLDLLYGYVQLEGLFDDRLTVQLGRVLADDGWGTTGIDGGTARIELPPPIAITATAGLRVRAASPLGIAAYELDGTSGAGCQEYVEGATPGTGAWKLIDRSRVVTDNRLSSDYEYCPQRDVRQPTIGATIATSRIRGWGAELGYRRTWSETVGLIGPVDRLAHPDLGLYPNEFGQAPGSAVDEERLWARAHGDFAAGDARLAPYADLRYSLLQGVLDRADVGMRIRLGDHALEPSVEYFYPTFDGDSIFNAFSIQPTLDARLAYSYRPLGVAASAWLRKYLHDDGDPTSAYAGGATAGIQRQLARRWRGGLDALWDDGYGGRRIGGTAEAMWHPSADLYLRGRAIVLGVREQDGAYPERAYVTGSSVLSTTWRVADTVALHGIVEADRDEIHHFQTRAIAILDLAFLPEP